MFKLIISVSIASSLKNVSKTLKLPIVQYIFYEAKKTIIGIVYFLKLKTISVKMFRLYEFNISTIQVSLSVNIKKWSCNNLYRIIIVIYYHIQHLIFYFDKCSIYYYERILCYWFFFRIVSPLIIIHSHLNFLGTRSDHNKRILNNTLLVPADIYEFKTRSVRFLFFSFCKYISVDKYVFLHFFIDIKWRINK